MTSKTLKQFVSISFGVIVLAIVLVVVLRQNDALTWLCAALGLGLGWGFGILVAPYQSEQERFREYSKVAAGFVTGYAVSKVDRLFELLLNPVCGPLVLNRRFVIRAMVLLVCFVSTTVLTYVSRKYVSFGPNAEGAAV